VQQQASWPCDLEFASVFLAVRLESRRKLPCAMRNCQPRGTPTTSLLTPSLWLFGGLSPWQLLKRVVREAQREDLLGAASNLAFNWLLALFPMLVFVLALFGIFASHHRQLEDSLFSFTEDLLPYPAYRLLGQVAGELTTSSGGGKLTLGLVAALWFASGGMTSLIFTLNIASRVRESRSWWRIRGIGIGLTVVMSVLLCSALFLIVIGDRFLDWLRFHFHWTSALWPLWKGLRWPAAAVFVAISFSLIDYFGPNVKEHRWRWLSPGSVFGVLLWLAASLAFRAYLHFFNTYSATYGSLGAVMILLIWLYATGLAFLIGGVINAEIKRATTGEPQLE
jgi:membrane protein